MPRPVFRDPRKPGQGEAPPKNGKILRRDVNPAIASAKSTMR